MRLLNFLTSRNQEVVLPLSIGKVRLLKKEKLKLSTRLLDS